jgi:hypothetical protein
MNKDKEIKKLAAELERLQKLLNTPEIIDFLRGVELEAAHQVIRWGEPQDRSKSAENWFWLVDISQARLCAPLLRGTKIRPNTIRSVRRRR